MPGGGLVEKIISSPLEICDLAELLDPGPLKPMGVLAFVSVKAGWSYKCGSDDGRELLMHC